jgi:hypothetical protein
MWNLFFIDTIYYQKVRTPKEIKWIHNTKSKIFPALKDLYSICIQFFQSIIYMNN